MTTCYPSTAIISEESALEDADPELADIALSLAWSTIQKLSAFQIAICPVIVRPCARRWWDYASSYIQAPLDGPGGAWVWPMMMPGGDIVNVLLCGCDWGSCHCARNEVYLPGQNASIEEILIGSDATPLTLSAYRVDNGHILVRHDGQAWPEQNLNVAAGVDGAWTVTYWRGIKPNEQINWIAGVLANEWLLGVQGDKKCRLPAGTTQVNRLGTTYTVELDWFDKGLTGIREVDDVLGLYNPYRKKAPALLLSPDAPPARVTTFGA